MSDGDELRDSPNALMHVTYRVMAASLDGDDDTVDAIMTGTHRRAAIDGLVLLSMRGLRAMHPGIGDRYILIKLLVDTLPEAIRVGLDELP
jgi:hypothetical protein